MTIVKLALAVLLSAVLFTSMACEREGTFEKAGEEVDRSVGKAGEEVEQAGEEMQKSLGDAGEKE
jgi:hypothetical protein